MKKIFSFLIFVLILHFTFNIKNCEAQWVQMSNGMFNNQNVYSLTVSGNNIFAGTSASGVYLSTNNGNNWTQTTLNNRYIMSLAASGNNIFAGTNGSGVYLSTNNGTSWVQTALNNHFVFYLAISGNNIFAGTNDSGVYLSTNSGTSWTQTALNNQSVRSLAVSGNNIFAGTYGYGVYLSTNNGTTWTQTGLNTHIVYFLAISGNNTFAGTGTSGVYLSTNNGTSWTQTALNNHSVLALAASGNNIFAGAGDGVWLSTNNGTNWLQKNQGFSVITLVSALLITNNYIFAGTYGNSVWRRSLTEIIGLQNISTEIPSAFSLSQNYPNPFNPGTKFKVEIAKSGNVLVKVFDVLGREVATLVNEQLKPGTYEVDWDASQYSSGIYFYTLTTQSYRETKRMVLIK
jgi:hypothetical protein